MAPITSHDPLSTASVWRWALGGCAWGMLLAMMVFAPARWLAQGVAWASDGRWILEDARGSVWKGSAQWVMTGGPRSHDAVALPSRWTWTLRPTRSGLRLLLNAPCCTPEPVVATLQAQRDGLTLTLMDVAASRWPAALLAGLGTPWNTLQLQGQLQLATHGLTINWRTEAPQVWRLEGHAHLLALDMTSRLTPLRPMGSYRITLAGGELPTIHLSTLAGGLRVTGIGHWQASRLRFRGEATATPERAAVLDHLLNLIGRREGARSIIILGSFACHHATPVLA